MNNLYSSIVLFSLFENQRNEIEELKRTMIEKENSKMFKSSQTESFIDLNVESTVDEDGWFDASPDLVENDVSKKIRRFIVENSSIFLSESTNLVEDVDQLLSVIIELNEKLRR